MQESQESTVSVVSSQGSPVFAQTSDSEPEFARADLDAALADLDRHKDKWVGLGLEERIAILEEVRGDILQASAGWAAAAIKAKGIPNGSSRAGEEWGGIAVVLRLARLLTETLRQLNENGVPRLPGKVSSRENGQLEVPVFPQDIYDRIFYPGVKAHLWLEPGTTEEELRSELGGVYRREPPAGQIALVLAAGNYSNLGPDDLLYKLFCELQVVILKVNPVTAYLRPIWEQAFKALIRRGYLRIVGGGAETGAYLAEHPKVAALHLTGSDKTYNAVVYGSGDEGRRNREAQNQKLDKPFTAELGNVSPLIVVPGPWSAADLRYQGEHIASTLTLNAGFNCLSTRVIVQHKSWSQRQELLEEVRSCFSRTPTRKAYYPGASEIHQSFVESHPEAEQIGTPEEGHLPWTMITDVDPEKTDDRCFRTEAFCSLFSETALDARSVPEFIETAVDFVNDKLWGSLSATILIHPRSMKNAQTREALERAVQRLRYGTVGVNVWGAMGFLLTTPTWGAFPGHPPHDIQSGTGTVNNTFMVPRVQKSVLSGPFRSFPKPPLFVSHRSATALFRKLVAFEASPSPGKLPGLLLAAMRG